MQCGLKFNVPSKVGDTLHLRKVCFAKSFFFFQFWIVFLFYLVLHWSELMKSSCYFHFPEFVKILSPWSMHICKYFYSMYMLYLENEHQYLSWVQKMNSFNLLQHIKIKLVSSKLPGSYIHYTCWKSWKKQFSFFWCPV